MKKGFITLGSGVGSSSPQFAEDKFVFEIDEINKARHFLIDKWAHHIKRTE